MNDWFLMEKYETKICETKFFFLRDLIMRKKSTFILNFLSRIDLKSLYVKFYIKCLIKFLVLDMKKIEIYLFIFFFFRCIKNLSEKIIIV